MSNLRAAACILCVMAAPGATGDEGRIPIYQPTTITSPGSYILTRDLITSGMDVITIQASHVTLDLGGWRIQGNDSSSTLIRIEGSQEAIRIRNGRLRGGMTGVGHLTPDRISLWLEGVEIADSQGDAVSLSGLDHVEMRSCKIRNAGNVGVFLAPEFGGTYTGRIVGNQFHQIAKYAITETGGTGLVIRDNVISHVGFGGIAIGLAGGSAIIEGNSMIRDPDASFTSQGIQLGSPGCRVANNVIRGFSRGILAGSAGGDGDHRIEGNVITGSVVVGAGLGDGIYIASSRNAIRGNQIEGGAGCGIRLDADSSDNAYGANMLRGSAGGAVCDSGTGNTDAGGNVL